MINSEIEGVVVDVVEGKALQVSDAVYAYQLDGKG